MSAPQPVTIPDNRTPLLDGNGLLSRPWMYAFQNLVSFIVGFLPRYLSNTHAKRLALAAGNYPDGTVFYETDRTLYYIARGQNWVYFSGTWSLTQEQFTHVSDLGANDANALLYVNDYAHLLQWTGANFQWGPGEQGSDLVIKFASGPGFPIGSGIGWQVCDGSTVPRLNFDGTLTMVTVPNLTPQDFYRQ